MMLVKSGRGGERDCPNPRSHSDRPERRLTLASAAGATVDHRNGQPRANEAYENPYAFLGQAEAGRERLPAHGSNGVGGQAQADGATQNIEEKANPAPFIQ